MKKELSARKAGELFLYDGFLHVGQLMRCSVSGDKKNQWIFVLGSFMEFNQIVIIGMTEKEEYLEVQTLGYPQDISTGDFINQYLKKYCHSYKGKIFVEMKGWEDEPEI